MQCTNRHIITFLYTNLLYINNVVLVYYIQLSCTKQLHCGLVVFQMHLIKIKPAAPLGIIGLTSAAITIALLSAPNMNTKNNNVRKLDPPSLTFFTACSKIPILCFIYIRKHQY